MTTIVRFGTPAYRMQVHGHHAANLINLVNTSRYYRSDAIDWQGAHYEHTSLLPAGRAKILHDAIVGEGDGEKQELADYLMGWDTDTWCDDPDWLIDFILDKLNARSDWALCLVEVPQDNGKVNLWSDQFVKVSEKHPVGEMYPIWAGGLAVAFYNLAWYRLRMGEPGWPFVSFGIIATGLPFAFLGEDAFHCRFVAEAGGGVFGVRPPDRSVKHAAFRG